MSDGQQQLIPIWLELRRMSQKERGIKIEVERGDALAYECDVLGLKYAQALFGVDESVVEHLSTTGVDLESRLPKVSGILLNRTVGDWHRGALAATSAVARQRG
jgi:hypothetical protein